MIAPSPVPSSATGGEAEVIGGGDVAIAFGEVFYGHHGYSHLKKRMASAPDTSA
jgi:hypothetical protein